MKITIFINFFGLLKNPIAITLDDSHTLTELNQIRIKEHKTPYDSVNNSRAAMPLQYQHKNRVFTQSDLNKSLHELGLQDNDSININISNIDLEIMRHALTADLVITNVDDPRSHSTPLSLGLIAQRQLSNRSWTKKELNVLKYDIAFCYAIWLPNEKLPHAYNQLTPLSSVLNLLISYSDSEEKSTDFHQKYTKYYMQRFLNAAGDLATLNHVVEEWNISYPTQSVSFTLLELMLTTDLLFSVQATVLIIGYLATPIKEEILAKPSLSNLMPKTLQNIIEEKNNVLLKFSHHTRDDHLLLFRNELRFLFKEKKIKDSEVNFELLGGNIITITNMNTARLLKIDAIPIVLDVMKYSLLTDLEETKPNPIPYSLALMAKRQLSKKPWTKQEILALQNNLAEVSGDRPGDYSQLLPQYATLNLLRSQTFTQQVHLDIHYDQMDELRDTLNESKVDFNKIKNILSQNTCVNFPLGTGLKKGCVAPLAKALQHNKTITTFRLSEEAFVAMDRQAVTALAEALRWNTTVEILELNNADIVNGGIAILVTGLKSNKTLLTLKIFESTMSEKDVEALADLLRTNTTLRSVNLHLLDSTLMNKVNPLIAAAKKSTTLENFTFNKVEIFKRNSLQLIHRRDYTSHYMLSLLHNDFEDLTNVTRRSGHLNFQFVDLAALGEIIIELRLLPTVLVEFIKEYLEKGMNLVPFPPQRTSSVNFLMTREILAKKPSLTELTKDIVLNIKETKDSIVITFTENTTIPRKLLLRNVLMDLFREKQMKETIADVSSSTGLLTIRNVTFEKLEELNIIPRNHNNRCIIA